MEKRNTGAAARDLTGVKLDSAQGSAGYKQKATLAMVAFPWGEVRCPSRFAMMQQPAEQIYTSALFDQE